MPIDFAGNISHVVHISTFFFPNSDIKLFFWFTISKAVFLFLFFSLVWTTCLPLVPMISVVLHSQIDWATYDCLCFFGQEYTSVFLTNEADSGGDESQLDEAVDTSTLAKRVFDGVSLSPPPTVALSLTGFCPLYDFGLKSLSLYLFLWFYVLFLALDCRYVWLHF